MDPPVQYSHTTDGVNIGFWTMGEGKPLIVMPSLPWSHLQLEWTIPEYRRWYTELGRGRRLVRYDGRGFGLSQGRVDDLSLEAQVRDLEAVIDAVGIEEVDLYGGLHSGPVAVAYAARYPERVTHLVLFCSYANGARFAESPIIQATRPIINQAWAFYSEVVARLLLGWSETEAAERFAALVRECVTPDMAHRTMEATTTFDVTGLLPDVRSPTLILHRRELIFATMDDPRTLAAGIPGARLSLLEGTSVAPYLGDTQAVVREIDAFLTDRAATPPGRAGGDPNASALRTILFTDVAGSTTLTQRLGDSAARDVLREAEQIVRQELGRHGGTEIKTMGDGFMASFGSAIGAVECAIALQRSFAAHNQSATKPLLIRVGMSAGEPIAEADDLFGTAVIAASRIGAGAAGGEIHVADVVRQLVAGKGFRFTDLGEVALRGFDDPTRLYEVRWAEDEVAGHA